MKTSVLVDIFDPRLILPHADVFLDCSDSLLRHSAFCGVCACVREREGERPLTKHVCCVIPDERLMSGRLCQQQLFVYCCVGVRSPPSLSEPSNSPGLTRFRNEHAPTLSSVLDVVSFVKYRVRLCVCVRSTAGLRLHVGQLWSWKAGPQAAQLPEIPAFIPSAARSPPADTPPHPRWRLHWTG